VEQSRQAREHRDLDRDFAITKPAGFELRLRDPSPVGDRRAGCRIGVRGVVGDVTERIERRDRIAASERRIGGPTTKVISVVPVSAPPRIVELAKWKPLHVSWTALLTNPNTKKTRLDPDRRYLIHAKVESVEGDRYDMGRFSLDVPKTVRGANLVSPGKWLWFVIENPAFEEGDTPRLVVHAAAVVEELFP
jgi:hypothetical protein